MPGIALPQHNTSSSSIKPNPEQSHHHHNLQHRHIQHHPAAAAAAASIVEAGGKSPGAGTGTGVTIIKGAAEDAVTQQPIPQFNTYYLPPSPPRSRSPSPYFAGNGPSIRIDTSLAAPGNSDYPKESITSPVLASSPSFPAAGGGPGPRLRMSSTATTTATTTSTTPSSYPHDNNHISHHHHYNNNNHNHNAVASAGISSATAPTMQRRPSQNESPLLGGSSNGNGMVNTGYRMNGEIGAASASTDDAMGTAKPNHRINGHVHFDTTTTTSSSNGGTLPNGGGYANGYGGYHNHNSPMASKSPLSPTFGSSPTFTNAPFIGSIYHKASDLIKDLPFNPVSSSSSSNGNLPTHALSSSNGGGHLQSSSSISRIGHHNRRKSVAQAITPSISTVRFASLCSLWYTSSALSSNTGKSILINFKYPVTLTFIQFGFVAGWCIIFCVGRTKFAQLSAAASGSGSGSSVPAGHPHHARALSVSQIHSASGWGIKKPSKKALEGTLVMSGFQIAGHIFSSMAIARVPVSTVHTIKALSPLFTVLCYGLLFRVRYSYNTYVSLLPLTVGVMLACSFDLRANAPGLVCALGSTLVFVSQNIFSKKLLPKEGRSEHGAGSEGKLDKLHLLLYSSGLAFLLMIPLWAYYDGYRLLFGSNIIRTASIPRLTFYFALNGSVHFLQNLLAFSILALCSPVTYSIASLIKRIAVICMAILWFGQTVYPVQAVGISMTFLGLWMYNSAKKDVERGESLRTKVERKGSVLLPSTKEDLSDTETSKARGWAIVR